MIGELPRQFEREQQAQMVCHRRFDRPDHLLVFRQRIVASVGRVRTFHQLRHSCGRFAGACTVRPGGGFGPRLVEEGAARAVLQQEQLEHAGVAL